MRTKNKAEEERFAKASLIRRAWLSIILFFLAIIVVGFGVYLSSQPEWAKRVDIKLYNRGVSTYALPVEVLPATDDRPAEYPITRAAAYFLQSASKSTDSRLITMGLYNLGTLMGKDALTVISGNTSSFGLTDAINILAEAVRTDPGNEDAKYNLELLEKLQEAFTKNPVEHNMPMAALLQKPGYYSGTIDIGF